jgi:prepilin peptidase CpaA
LLLRTFDPVVVCVVAGCGIASAAIDLRERRVPNPLTLGIAGLGLLLAALHTTGVGVTGALAGMGLGLALMLPGHLIGATGAGDVKLMAAVGSFLGPSLVFRAFLYSALAGGVLALAVATRRGLLTDTMLGTTRLVTSPAATRDAIVTPGRGNRFAYGPAIAVGTLITLLVQP